ncbi:MAG TPA: hypothetical protein GX745_01020 [Clostridiales bacterium]|jgi:hypothetical protein|nr:hypothetical protein [Clostridiales bacterium]
MYFTNPIAITSLLYQQYKLRGEIEVFEGEDTKNLKRITSSIKKYALGAKESSGYCANKNIDIIR